MMVYIYSSNVNVHVSFAALVRCSKISTDPPSAPHICPAALISTRNEPICDGSIDILGKEQLAVYKSIQQQDQIPLPRSLMKFRSIELSPPHS